MEAFQLAGQSLSEQVEEVTFEEGVFVYRGGEIVKIRSTQPARYTNHAHKLQVVLLKCRKTINLSVVMFGVLHEVKEVDYSLFQQEVGERQVVA